MIARDSGLAMLTINHLPRSVIGIRQERKVYDTFRLVICDWWLVIWRQNRFVALEDIAALEIGLQFFIDLGRLRQHKESTRVLIQSMRRLGMQQTFHRRFVRLTGHGEQTGWLIDHHQPLILE